MYRKAIEELAVWKTKKNRKPLIIEGARQVGKTWIMKEFAKSYKDSVYINFDNNEGMQELFSKSFEIESLILGLEIYANKKITADTLLIFDEVQEVPRALSSLKYFNENAPQYPIICAGSLLGIALHQGTSFPVGKVEFLKLYPLSFYEFLLATGQERFAKLLQKKDFSMITTFKEKYIDALRHYYFVGGMPEAVEHFSLHKDFSEVRAIQERILNAYEQDFSKHAPHNIVPKIRMIWNSIPSQLAKENKKFLFGLLREGARAKDFEVALLWLSDCGLIHKVSRVTKPLLPLKAYEELKHFKLFLLDVGLLSCMAGLSAKTLLEGNQLFKEFKGSLTEQYVLQELKTIEKISTYYYTNERASAEIDFLLDTGSSVIPLEVKAEVNLMAKSLKSYREKYKPKLAIRTSMTDYKEEEGLLNLPLYLLGVMDEQDSWESWFKTQVERGQADAKEGRVSSHEEVEARAQKRRENLLARHS